MRIISIDRNELRDRLEVKVLDWGADSLQCLPDEERISIHFFPLHWDQPRVEGFLEDSSRRDLARFDV